MIFLMALNAPQVRAQYFGQNRVQHYPIDFKVIHTNHFEVHYSAAERGAAIDAARLAERAYKRLTRQLSHEYN